MVGLGRGRIRVRAPVGVQTDRICGGARDPEVEPLRQRRLLEREADFEVVDSFRVGDVRPYSRVRQLSLLIDGRGLIREAVPARAVGVLVLTEEPAKGEEGR